jgi:tetratricopeptide (TPR) repeat protein
MPQPNPSSGPRRSTRGRVSRWLKGRRYSRLAAALPVLFACIALAGLLVYRAGWKPSSTEAKVRGAASRAMASRDFKRAVLAYQELLQLRADSQPDYRFQLALSLRGAGRDRESGALLRSLAPYIKPVYAPAHFYLAKVLLGQTNANPALRATAERHLAHVLALEPKNAEAQELAGRLHLGAGRLDQAKKHLLEAVSSRNDAMLPLAAVLRAQGDVSGARNWLERAQRYYRDRISQGSGADPEANLGLARVLTELGDYAGAVSVLETALKLQPAQEYAAAIGNVCSAWSASLDKDKPGDAAERLMVVERGLNYAPRNFNLLNQLADITEATGPAAESARTQLKEMLTDGGKVAFVHFCLGLRADQKGDLETALKHYSLAYELGPDMVYVANNLALTLAFGPKPDLERAISLMDGLVKATPDDLRLRDSRGQVLLQLKRYKEAVKDLELGLTVLPADQRSGAWAALALAYQGLGMPDVAATYAAKLPGGTNSLGRFQLNVPGLTRPPTADQEK